MKTFSDLNLSDEIFQSLEKLDFVKPTATQIATLEKGMEGKDILVCAATGTGKTAAFSIPLVEKLISKPDSTALILAPTRELAQQIASFVRELIQFREELKVCTIVGGADIRKQLAKLKKNPNIIVATPGRLIDHIKRKSVNLSNCSYLVLDEGDRMLDMGFAPQLEQIFKVMPKRRQSALFTATMPNRIKKLSAKHFYKPETIIVGKQSMPVKTIKQTVIQVTSKEKIDIIIDELNARQGSIIVFLKTKRGTDKLYRTLKSYGFKVSSVHGDKSQGQRNKAINLFRDGSSRILCATDVAARGLDIPAVEHVINYDLPMMEEDYVHRIGRTARNGNTGEALSFVGENDHRTWMKIARKYKIPNVELKPIMSKKITVRNNTSKKKFTKKKRAFKKSNSKNENQFKKKKRNKLKNAPKRKKRKVQKRSSR